MIAAFLWILMYLFAPDNMGVRDAIAIFVGAILMWVLFLWSFFLVRKLNRITRQVKDVEARLLRHLEAEHEKSSQ